MTALLNRAAAVSAIALMPLLLSGCELGSKETTQLGPRGAGMEQVTNLNLVAASVPPPSAYALETREGQRAREIYPNLRVLGDISVEEFGLLMANITEWVVPKDAPPEQASCNYCHNPENMASYEKYTKTVSLNMLRMTQNINVNWQQHVQQTGVTCYTCHRGKALPEHSWSFQEESGPITTIRGNLFGQNAPDPAVGYSSLPNNNFGPYFAQDPREIRVTTPGVYPTATSGQIGIKDAEATYGLMMHMSSALGVNCTYCHNSHNFGDWTNSRLQRVPAWHGINMVRSINDQYIQPLQSVFPVGTGRLGPAGDPLKVNCQTCHVGQPKPLGGVSMLADNPALREFPPAPAVDGSVIVAGAARTDNGVAAGIVAVPATTAAAVAAVAPAARAAIADAAAGSTP